MVVVFVATATAELTRGSQRASVDEKVLATGQAWWFAGLSLLGCGAAIVAWLWPQRELGQRDDAPHAEAAS
jgi:hypothetical protein